MKTDKVRPPTERQVRLLRGFNYRGPAPATIHEAAQILNKLSHTITPVDPQEGDTQ